MSKFDLFKFEKRYIKQAKNKYSNYKDILSTQVDCLKNEISKDNLKEVAKNYSAENKFVKIIKELKSTLIWFFCVMAIVSVLDSHFALSIVNGLSMYETYDNGDVLLINRTQEVKKQDVIVFKADEILFPGSKETIIKRVIATEGDTIEIKENEVYVNDEKINEPYVQGLTSDYAKETIKDNCVFVLGDNREISKDSRMVGQIPIDMIIGIVNRKLM